MDNSGRSTHHGTSAIGAVRGRSVRRPGQRAARIVMGAVMTLVAAGGAVVQAPTASAAFVCGHSIGGAIEGKWNEKGGLGGPLGCPTSDELVNPDVDGRRQHFGDRGHIYWRNYTGAHPIWGTIAWYWGNAGYERSIWRYPRTDEFAEFKDGYWFFWQDFECGRIVASQGFPVTDYTCV